MKSTRLQVSLRDVQPEMLRVIDVPATTTLPELHEVLQAAVGWTDSHLHQFVTPQATYAMALPDDDLWPEDARDEADGRLADLGEAFEYRYDFGDGWVHDVRVLGPGAAAPGCVDGHGACPPEDCGGPGGYSELLDTLADPAHPDHNHMRSWVGNRLPPFDVAEADRRVRETVGAVPASVRLLLDLLVGGVKLTPGGRLPRVTVREVQQHRPHWYPLDRPASIEEDLYPLAVLHDLLRRAGLLRLRHGVLAPTRAAGDDLAVVRRLRAAFKSEAFETQLIEMTVGMLAAHGPSSPEQLAARLHPMFADRWRRGDRPLTQADVRGLLGGESALMTALDLIDETDWDAWTLGPSARSLLPGAALLAEVWGRGEGEF